MLAESCLQNNKFEKSKRYFVTELERNAKSTSSFLKYSFYEVIERLLVCPTFQLSFRQPNKRVAAIRWVILGEIVLTRLPSIRYKARTRKCIDCGLVMGNRRIILLISSSSVCIVWNLWKRDEEFTELVLYGAGGVGKDIRTGLWQETQPGNLIWYSNWMVFAM